MQITRRAIVKGGLMASAAVSALGLIGTSVGVAAELPALDPADATATALGFINDASKVDAAANPRFMADQKCGNCEQYQGKKDDVRAGCVLFPGKTVPAAGWCKVWRKAP